MTTSAISLSRLPLGCLGVTALVCSRLVTAMTAWPSRLGPSATPTIEPLTPELRGDEEDVGGVDGGDRANSSSTTVGVALQRGRRRGPRRRADRAGRQSRSAMHAGRDEARPPGRRSPWRRPASDRSRTPGGRRRAGWSRRQVDGLVQAAASGVVGDGSAGARTPARGRSRRPPRAWRRRRCSWSSACFLGVVAARSVARRARSARRSRLGARRCGATAAAEAASVVVGAREVLLRDEEVEQVERRTAGRAWPTGRRAAGTRPGSR